MMGIFQIKLNGVPVISLIMCVGVGVEFTAHITLAFIMAPPPPAATESGGGAFATKWWCCGCRHVHSNDQRVAQAMALMFAATFHGSVSTFLGILMLAFSAFDFIVKCVRALVLSFSLSLSFSRARSLSLSRCVCARALCASRT
jgi:patched 1 protein